MTSIRPALLLLPALAFSTPAGASEVVLGALRDTTIYAESGNESNGSGVHFFAGTTGMGQLRRGLLRFDAAAGVPAGSVITNVELTLYMSKTNAGARTIRLHRALADWGQGTSNAPSGEGGGAPAAANDATWTRRFFPGTSWTTLGGDFDATASAATAVDQIGFYQWSGPGLVADVQSMLDAPAGNFGWLLQNDNEVDQPTAKRFDTRENPEAAFRPSLRVVFGPPCAASSSTYCVGAPNSTGVGAAIGWSGTLSIAANDFTVTCAQLPPNTPHVYYFGTQTAQTAFGDGFRCVTGSTFRLNPPIVATPTGTSMRAIDLASPPAFGNITAGSTVYFQCWYRNPAANGAGFNLSDGLSATFCN